MVWLCKEESHGPDLMLLLSERKAKDDMGKKVKNNLMVVNQKKYVFGWAV